MRDSPELIESAEELKQKIKTIQEHLHPLLSKVKSKQLATADGLSYLEVKFHLLLSYCIDIVFYMMRKAAGKPVKDHPVIKQLVELRLILEKIKPIDERLKYQIDKLITLASNSADTISK